MDGSTSRLQFVSCVEPLVQVIYFNLHNRKVPEVPEGTQRETAESKHILTGFQGHRWLASLLRRKGILKETI